MELNREKHRSVGTWLLVFAGTAGLIFAGGYIALLCAFASVRK